MTTVNIRGIPVSFPFKPYEIQKDYMEKVIECLQTESNGVLESPTGTGKTLSLLCSSLAWLTVQKAKYQAEVRMCGNLTSIEDKQQSSKSAVPKLMWDIPTIVYASRTHSQLTQAMQELKRTSYAHVRSTIIGSRDQLCIHPDVVQQLNNTNKISMCQAMVKSRSCYLHSRVEKMSNEKVIHDLNIADIEDLVRLGGKHKFCPYYMVKELKKQADIIFLPYNYLLDPKARRANQLDLKNCVIILDEAHNVEKVCEDSTSFQLRTTDIALCIDEVTQVMKYLETFSEINGGDAEKDFSAEDLALLKTMLLNLEKVIDDIPLTENIEGSTYEGKYIFDILQKAGINDSSQMHIISLLDRLIQFMTTNKENPFQRTGTGLQILQDILLIVFQKITEEFKEKINKCYKVHLIAENEKKVNVQGTWLSKASAKEKSTCRVLSYWCFTSNFAMQMLLEQGVRCVILTSGTLAPLPPLISELGIDIKVRLESPHVVNNKQICVKILSVGPDGVTLNSSFQNRDNHKYINSLGMSIVNISRQIPSGLLIFFPSYAALSKCQEAWQQTGIWNSMNELKAVFVEPKTKDAFNTIMHDFYDRVKNPLYKGAIFMAVCRGKVSEGLDFADINGRAVIITGLPYPPFKDPRVILKKKYLDNCKSKNADYLSGQAWYGLEATRAVNQAIGRVIRHRYDYGAILLFDSRFNNSFIKNQLSLWVRGHVKSANSFRELIVDMKTFFKNATEFDSLAHQKTVDNIENISSKCQEVKIYSLNKNKENFLSEPSTSFSNNAIKRDNLPAESRKENNEVNLNKRGASALQDKCKRMKIIHVDYSKQEQISSIKKDTVELIELIKKNIDRDSYEIFINGLNAYKNTSDIKMFIEYLTIIFKKKAHLHYLLQGLLPYVKGAHKQEFLEFWHSIR